MAGAGFKTFNTGDVLTSSDVNTYLMQQTVMVFDDASARSTALPTPSEGMFSYLKDTNLTYRYDGSAWLSDAGTTSPLTTKGDVWGYSTADARIPVGADGTVLTADSAEALGVKWAAAGGGGKVLQVVNATYSTEFTTTSNTLADTGLTASITPAATNSKILILITYVADVTVVSNYLGWNVAILRGATSIWTSTGYGGSAGMIYGQGWTNTNINRQTKSLTYLDSPSTTSATTYKLQGAKEFNTPSVKFNPTTTTSSITLLEIGA